MARNKTKSQLKKEKVAKEQAALKLLKQQRQFGAMSLFRNVDSKPKKRKPELYSGQITNVRYTMDNTKSIPSNDSFVADNFTPAQELSEEMQARELAALEEKRRKSKRIAPAYNKGAYQYITDDTDPTTIGRKL